MREFWVVLHTSPILYRYIDWSITVPLQMIEFNLILKAVKPDIGAGMFWRLLLGTVVMLAAGYCGEAGFVNAYAGFAVGMAGWGFILMEIFVGEAGQAAGGGAVNKYVSESFNTMRLIVTAGWSIYPLGYFFGYLMGAVNDDVLNLVYNLADFVNKIAFCLAIGLVPRAALWNQQSSNVHSSADSMQAVSVFTFCFLCMSLVSGFAHKIRACTFHSDVSMLWSFILVLSWLGP